MAMGQYAINPAIKTIALDDTDCICRDSQCSCKQYTKFNTVVTNIEDKSELEQELKT